MPDSVLLEGSLDALTLAGVLQLVASEGIDARVEFARGHVTFADGILAGAGFLGLSGSPAVVEASVRARGRFALVPSLPDGATSRLGDVGPLVIEGFRISDEIVRFGARIPESGLAIGSVQGDGETPLSNLITTADAHLVDVVPAVLALEASGVAVGSPSDADPLAPLLVTGGIPTATPARSPLDDLSFDDLVFAARRLVRDRRLAEARAHLSRAAELRPDDRLVTQNLRRLDALEARIS